jgi:uncharacterized protein with ParB-like and HNH nuclease domain
MATLNSTIKPGHHPLSDVVAAYREERYVVDDRFQRRLVWTPKQKVRLIETILMGYPMPEIYLHQLEAGADGKQVFSIVDGQQRITTIFQFVSNEWSIDARFLDKKNQKSPYSNCKWNDLTNDLKKSFWAYTINSRIIPPEITIEEIKAIFRRLNESDKSLNPQELRHAEFSGKIIKLAENLADMSFWDDWGVFTTNNIRRMADVEATTSLISYLRNGIVTDNAETINGLYDLFNENYPDEKRDQRVIKSRLSVIDDIFDRDDVVSEFFAKSVHIYTLFTLFDTDLKLQHVNKLSAALRKFAQQYSGELKASKKIASLLEEYRSGSVQRTRSRGSRVLRHDALYNYLKLEGL